MSFKKRSTAPVMMSLSRIVYPIMILLLALLSTVQAKMAADPNRDEFYYGKFPEGFAFGAATAAYQIEGAWNVSGKGPSIWDILTHNNPKMYHNQTGDVACDSYHKYKEDVKSLKEMGATHYRFSLSWPRILPDGTKDNINNDGINYYKSLLKELKENDITPVVTLYHWDLPWAFYGMKGWTNESLVEYFVEYARICFREFGDDVKLWVTINEPQVIMARDPFFMYSYYLVGQPPAVLSRWPATLSSCTVTTWWANRQRSCHAFSTRLFATSYLVTQKFIIFTRMSLKLHRKVRATLRVLMLFLEEG